MPLKKCSAKDCLATASLQPDLPMFKFPRDVGRCRLWVRNSGNDKLLQSPSINLSVRKYMCADHFDEDQFFDKFRRRLRKTAVPSLFSCIPLSEELMSKFPVLDSCNLTNNCTGKLCHKPYGSLCRKYKSFPYSKATGNKAFPVVPLELEWERNNKSSKLKIPWFSFPSASHSEAPGHGSITYIEGPWCTDEKDHEQASNQISENSNEIRTFKCHVESGNDSQKAILQQVDVNNKGMELLSMQPHAIFLQQKPRQLVNLVHPSDLTTPCTNLFKFTDASELASDGLSGIDDSHSAAACLHKNILPFKQAAFKRSHYSSVLCIC